MDTRCRMIALFDPGVQFSPGADYRFRQAQLSAGRLQRWQMDT